MKIVTGRTMAEIDRIAISERGIPSLSLMERAGRAVAHHFHALCGDIATRVLILCGKGNNGGDGLVAARYLLGRGYRPKVVLTHPPEELSEDGKFNFNRFRVLPFARWSVWGSRTSEENFQGHPAVIDALLGTGAKGMPRPPYGEIIEKVNQSGDWALGVDIASGLDADTGEAAGEAIGCRSTLTFGLPMVGHFRGDGIDYTGTLSVADIGFPPDVIAGAESHAELITADWVRDHLPRYPRSVHKGDRGRILLVAGSSSMLGAAILAAKAAVRSGAGLTTLALPKSLNATVKSVLPEVMTLPLAESDSGEIALEGLDPLLSFAEGVNALGIGPGLGRSEGVRSLVRGLVERTECPLVLDADGLFAMSDEAGRKILKERAAPTVLTPHAGEFLRLMGSVSIEEFRKESWGKATEISRRLEVVLLLKGPATLIASPQGELFVNRSGHPSMSQGGMGDALTGIIATLLGEGLRAQEAASLGAFFHGRAGESAYRDQGGRTVTASELIDSLARVFRQLA